MDAADARRQFREGRFEDLDFTGSRLHGPSFEGTRVTDGWFRGADFSGDIEGLVVNGVEIAPLVSAELDRRFPERVQLRAAEPDGLAEAWQMVSDLWGETVADARRLPEGCVHERVDGEWSFVETLRHLIQATDIWHRGMILGQPRPYHPWGLAGSWLTDPASLGLEPEATPSLDEVVAVRLERMDGVARTIEQLRHGPPDELSRVCQPPDPTGHPREPRTVLECLHVLLSEEWEHHGYAVRDLAVLEAR